MLLLADPLLCTTAPYSLCPLLLPYAAMHAHM
jgi:hypothetical protein